MTTRWMGEKERAAVRADAAKTYKEMANNINRMGTNVLKYMRHPDATPEDAEQVRKQYCKVYKNFVDTTNILREKFPVNSKSWSSPDPWMKPINETIR